MTYSLYYAENSAAMGVRVLLEEMRQPYDLIGTSIDMDTPRPPELLALNPNGWIPVLISDGAAIYECGAITTWLCDRHPDAGLAPGVDDPARGRFLQWLFFFSSSVQNAYQMSYYSDRFCDTAADEASVKRRSITRLRELWRVVDDAIGDNDWMLGEDLSAADIYLFMLTTWLSPAHEHPRVEEFANVHRIASTVSKRPSVQLVYGTDPA
ncbi:glutathione S-transferase N-terminal domain-containing protein [Anderseniella sp. Alg231-50]|uniref:glutathione S-transferase N-terminal domain-containing protein n=1 Tax=Anderseniella sp. Alg231-50 TaxID=1922226 RepID=UPI000D551008